MKIKKKYEAKLNIKNENNSKNKDIQEKSMKDFKDTDYSDNNKYFRRIANFTFIRKNESKD